MNGRVLALAFICGFFYCKFYKIDTINIVPKVSITKFSNFFLEEGNLNIFQ
jgi:hypothetical protein